MPLPGGFCVGDIVELRNVVGPGEQRATGMVMKHLGGDKWSVIMDDADGGSKVASAKDLRKFRRPPRKYSIVGSWDDWEVHDMIWDPDSWCFEYDVPQTRTTGERFMVLLEGNWERCVYPDRLDAVPGDGHQIHGPDDGSSQEWTIGEWTVGRQEEDGGQCIGDVYKVRFFMLDDGSPKDINWEMLPRERNIPKYSITGSWDDWDSHEMTWNTALGCYEHLTVVGDSGVEKFRLLLEGNWEKCVYPDSFDASPDDGHRILGPDDGGSLGEWGLRGRAGSRWQIRFFLQVDGQPQKVEWEFQREERSQPVPDAKAAAPAKTSAPQGLPPAEAHRGAAASRTGRTASRGLPPRVGGSAVGGDAAAGPAAEEDNQDALFDSLLAEVFPRWTKSARSELAGMGVRDMDELREAITGPLCQWCKATLGVKAVQTLCMRLDVEPSA